MTTNSPFSTPVVRILGTRSAGFVLTAAAFVVALACGGADPLAPGSRWGDTAHRPAALLGAAGRQVAAPQERSEIAQFGVTWSFDRKYPVGQFANGDWWVVGPVKIVAIDPASRPGTRVLNGSMINPSPRMKGQQGYDSKMKHNSYDDALNVALGLSKAQPLLVKPHSSLVSAISQPKTQTPQLAGAQILTVLPSPAEPGDFRPAYCGSDKSIRFNVKQLKTGLLKQLKPAPGTPRIADIERSFERPWLDHIPGWGGSEHHPKANMPHYGRDLSTVVGEAALILHLDFSLERKRVLLVRYVQLGIDLMGIVEDGGDQNWMNNGGHASGRKWPILFAGLMLDDAKMKGIGSTKVYFGPDMQTFIVTKADVGRDLNPDKRAPKKLYRDEDVGKPEWGIRHTTAPISDNADWSATYRTCCTANAWNGFVLAARIMGAQKLWNHDPLFLYVDHYIATSRRLKIPAWQISASPWTLKMWDLYRGAN